MRRWTIGSSPLAIGALLACAPGLEFERPTSDQVVAGVVQVALRVDGELDGEAALYLDRADAPALGKARPDADGHAWIDWFTVDTSPGAHTLLARASSGGSTVEAALPVRVQNLRREDRIPAGAVKQTPADDAYPPQLEPAFAALFEPCAPLPAPLSSAGAEDSPYITPDGQELYLFFTPDPAVPANQQLLDGVTGIWRARRDGAAFGAPERVFLNHQHAPALDGCGTVYGDTLWWCSARAGNLRELDIYQATWRDGHWRDWRNAGRRLNLEVGLGELHVTAGGQAIYFHAARAGGQGGLDLWVTRRVDDAWTEPENLTALNSASDEGWPWVAEDESELWFTRAAGAPEIWRAQRTAAGWQAPAKVVGPFAGEPTLDDRGDLYFTHHFWDPVANAMREADIYRCARR